MEDTESDAVKGKAGTFKGPSHPYFLAHPNAPAAILSSIESAYLLSNLFPSKTSIVFSTHKPSYS